MMETKPARSMILPRMVVTGPGVLEQIPAIIAELDIPERGLIVCDTNTCLLYTSPSPRDVEESRMPSSA